MSTPAAFPAAVVCDDRPIVRHVLARVLVRNGFVPAVEVADLAALQDAVLGVSPQVVVLGLPVTGARGLQAVHAVRTVSPMSSVLVLSPFAALRPEALQAGASALLEEHDLPGLETALRLVLVQPVLPAPRPQVVHRAARRSSLQAWAGSVRTKPSS